MLDSLLVWDNAIFLANGLLLTIEIAVLTIICSIVFGTILAVARNYDSGVLKKISTVYIEIVRNLPILLWIFAIRFLVPGNHLFLGILALTIFQSAIIGEIVRGGLNAIPKGQIESAESQGFSFFGMLSYIILPQCFRHIIPALLSQMITIVKDTSLLWVVAIEEFTGKSMILMGSCVNTVQVFSIYAFMAFIYFTINFSLSLSVRNRVKNMIT